MANSAAVVMNEWLPRRGNLYFLLFLALIYPVTWALGRSLSQFRSWDELGRPQSLFDDSEDASSEPDLKVPPAR